MRVEINPWLAALIVGLVALYVRFCFNRRIP